MPEGKFVYMGKTLEELQNMSMEELIKLFPSAVRRSIKRGFTEQQKKLLKRLRRKERVKTHVRDMVVLPEMVGKTIDIFNGKEYHSVNITVEMIGHLVGEFALTRKAVKHSAPGLGATRSSKYVPLK